MNDLIIRLKIFLERKNAPFLPTNKFGGFSAHFGEPVRLRKSKKIISDGAIEFIERDNPNVHAYRRTLGNESLIVLCNFRDTETKLAEKTLSDYAAQGYKKILGNYDVLVENLRPFEVVVLEK